MLNKVRNYYFIVIVCCFLIVVLRNYEIVQQLRVLREGTIVKTSTTLINTLDNSDYILYQFYYKGKVCSGYLFKSILTFPLKDHYEIFFIVYRSKVYDYSGKELECVVTSIVNLPVHVESVSNYYKIFYLQDLVLVSVFTTKYKCFTTMSVDELLRLSKRSKYFLIVEDRIVNGTVVCKEK